MVGLTSLSQGHHSRHCPARFLSLSDTNIRIFLASISLSLLASVIKTIKTVSQ